jgi:hypothetical protein
MSISPIEWRAAVIATYDSIENFQDVSTVEIVREKIKSRHGDLRIMLDAEDAHHGALLKHDLKDIKTEDLNLASLDDELNQWQKTRPILVQLMR